MFVVVASRSPDGRRLAVRLAGEIVLLDPATGDTRCRLKTGAGGPAGLRFSPDGLQFGAVEPRGARI